MKLGYLGLDENHTQADGSRLDRLLLGFLRIYGECCTGEEPAQCQNWLRQASRFWTDIWRRGRIPACGCFHFKALKDW